MAVPFQLVIDCADPEPLARFWAAALGYELEPPPKGFASWDAYRRDLGVPEDELGTGADCIVDPSGQGPRIWFQVVPERKAVKNVSFRHANDGCGVRIMESAAEEQRARRLHLVLELEDALHEPLHVFVGHRGARLTLDAVVGEQVLGHDCSSCGSGGSIPPLTPSTNGRRRE